MEGRLRISLLAAVQLPTLWRRIDVSGNRRRHPADTEAEKDQQERIIPLLVPSRPVLENIAICYIIYNISQYSQGLKHYFQAIGDLLPDAHFPIS
jgi:hypothetical protein